MAEKLTQAQWNVLSKVRDDDAYWTSDIAYDAGHATHQIRPILKRLAALGLVEVVVEGSKGLPTSWRRTPAGRAILTGDSTHG